MRRRGFSLLEALFGVTILGALIGIVCAVFEVGASGYRLGNTRLELQSEMRRVLTPLGKDLKNSSMLSISVIPQAFDVQAEPPAPALVRVSRDGVACNGLHRRGLNAYSDKGLPRWDCYILYFATGDNPDGRLVRTLLRDPSISDGDPNNDVISVPLALTPGHLSVSHPDMLEGELRTLSTQVMEFRTELNYTEQFISVRLKVRGKQGRSLGRKTTAEVLETSLSVRPENTWPKL